MVPFPRAAGSESAKQSNIEIGNEVITDSAVAATADVVAGYQTMRREMPF